MAKRETMICDGCGKEEIIVGPEGGQPSCIKPILISLKGGADSTYELCPTCERRLQEYADPRKWPRSAARPAAA
jgi:hypothetical protein